MLFEEKEEENNTMWSSKQKTWSKEEIKSKYKEIEVRLKNQPINNQLSELSKCFEYECICYPPFLTDKHFDVDVLEKIKALDAENNLVERNEYIQLLCWGYVTLIKLEEKGDVIRMDADEIIQQKLQITMKDIFLMPYLMIVHDDHFKCADIMEKLEYMYYKILNKRDDLYFSMESVTF